MRFETSLKSMSDNSQKRVEYDDDRTSGVVLIAEEGLRRWGESVKETDCTTLEFTPTEAVWLLEQLTELANRWYVDGKREEE